MERGLTYKEAMHAIEMQEKLSKLQVIASTHENFPEICPCDGCKEQRHDLKAIRAHYG